MRKLLPALGVLMLAAADVAGAAEMTGPVTAVNLQTRTISIAEPSCGCLSIPFVFPADLTLAGITEGTTVTVTYTTSGTINTVSKWTK